MSAVAASAAVIGVIGYIASLLALRRSTPGRRLPAAAGAFLALACAAAVFGVGAAPWIAIGAAIAGGLVLAVTAAKLVDVNAAAVVNVVLISLAAAACTISGSLLLVGGVASPFGNGFAFSAAAGTAMVLAAGAALTGVVHWLHTLYAPTWTAPGSPFAWWAGAGVTATVGWVLTAVWPDAWFGQWAAAAAGAAAGVLTAMPLRAPLGRLLNPLMAPTALSAMTLGALAASHTTVLICGIGAGMALAASRAGGFAETTKPSTRAAVSVGDALALLTSARRVVIVPGSEVSTPKIVAEVRRLTERLRRHGAHISVVAHPASSGLPGHLAALLLHAGYDLSELITDPGEAHARLAEADVALLVGVPVTADALVRHEPWGALDVSKARHVVSLPCDQQRAAENVVDVRDIAIGNVTYVLDQSVTSGLTALARHP